MTSAASALPIHGLQQHPAMPLTPTSPRMGSPRQAGVPTIPPRRESYQRDRPVPWTQESQGLRNEPAMPPSPDASGRAESHNARPLQLPYHNSHSSSRHDTVPLAGRLDDGPDRKSSRDGSLSSTGDSNETNATSTSFLSAAPSAKHLDKGSTFHALPEDYDLDASLEDVDQVEMLERVSELLFSAQHLQAIFNEPACLLRFTAFLSTHRPQSVPNLIYYLDATKALKAIRYANAVATGLESVSVGELSTTSKKTTNLELETKAQAAFNFLAENDLPAYTAHLYIQVVKSSMMKPVAQDPQLPEASEGFAEVFCLTDPSRPDNPICFASEAFHQMTQYSMNYIIGRNCRFLQGPKTNPASLERIRNAVVNKQEHCEVILNYRRDGSPFLNLLMHAPLYDHFGKLRYFMGAQIDVSNVIDESPELETLQRVIIQQDSRHHVEPEKNEFQQFVETLDMDELKAVRTWEDRMLHEMPEDEAPSRKTKSRRPGLARNHHSEILKNGSALDNAPGASIGMYQNYMLVRPYPSLKILFTSPSLSVPGVVQTPIMDRLGGSARVRYELGQALEEGREVTAKVRWKANEVEEGVDRWIFFTPLVGRKGEIGVWMAILEDDIPETMERTQQARTVKPNYGTTSPIPEEPEQEEPATRDVVLLHHTQPRGYRHSLDRNLSMTSQENHSPPLERVQRSREPSISGKTINSILSDNDNEYSSLEDRLRRKRERDMGMMLDQPGMALRKTYKSFAPDSFINY